MLSLVRTFASEPKIVVVDEASLGLAPIIVDRIFETLAEIAATGVSVLLVEQYVTRALALADWSACSTAARRCSRDRPMSQGRRDLRALLGVEISRH